MMNNVNVSELLGFACDALDDDGKIWEIDTPFQFDDGDAIPVFVEEVDQRLRFFDDGGILMRLLGLGYRIDEPGGTETLAALLAPSGASLSTLGEVETWADAGQVPAAFARYISAMLAVLHWERQQDAIAEERRRQNMAADAVNA